MFRSLYEWATKEEPDAIVTAAKKHNTKKVKQLLQRGVAVNTREKDRWDSFTEESGFTALARACEESKPTVQKTECITTLLEAKADPNCRSRFDTPLVSSAYQGNTTQIELLLKHKADVNLATRDWRRTALHAAAIEDHAESMRFLLESKADPQAIDREGFTALQLATQRDCLGAIQVMTDFFKQAETRLEPIQPPKIAEVENQVVVPAISPRSR